jgi:FkbM family methyltransferase
MGRLQNVLRAATGRQNYLSSEEEAYRRLKLKGYDPTSIIDVGARRGDWTRVAHRVFGSKPTLMVEARSDQLQYLQSVASPDVKICTALLTAKAGESVTFYEMGSGSSLFAENSNTDRRAVTLETQTLDAVAAEMRGPIFLKIDVQGAELEVLNGGRETLGRTDLVQLEVAVLPFNKGAPTMEEVLAYMRERGFLLYDISGLTRPYGKELVQADFLFTRHDSPLRPSIFEF